MSPATIRVAVFIDWQNTYKTAREAFGWSDYPNEYGNYSPYQLAQILAAGNERGTSGHLARVNIHRGRPSQEHDPQGYAANRRQAAAWTKEKPGIVIPRLRSLRYSPDTSGQLRAREKGVDVELALAAVEWTLRKKCDVAVIFSHDTDLVPLVEMLSELKDLSCIETASWTAESFSQRIRTKPPVYHHAISQTDFDRVETLVNYAHTS